MVPRKTLLSKICVPVLVDSLIVPVRYALVVVLRVLVTLVSVAVTVELIVILPVSPSGTSVIPVPPVNSIIRCAEPS